MPIVGGQIRTTIPIKIIKVNRWRKTVTFDVLVENPSGPTTVVEGVTVYVNYDLNVDPKPATLG